MITYRINNLNGKSTSVVNETTILAWLKNTKKATMPQEKLEQLKRDCFLKGRTVYGSVCGGSFILMTKTELYDKENKEEILIKKA
jgi:hypothetical protein